MGRPPRRRYQKNCLFALLNIGGGAIFIVSLLYKTSDLNRSGDGCRIDLRQQTKFRPSPSNDSRERNDPKIALLISFPNRCVVSIEKLTQYLVYLRLASSNDRPSTFTTFLYFLPPPAVPPSPCAMSDRRPELARQATMPKRPNKRK